ncbi:HAMP domain-containing protein [Chelativorans sp. ZYF759]|uniref:sensor histidine kinase n=1 Tax=Chelativorans sp. ZYF759 TaxID=2692213 RepID=UPI00145D58FF|nr:HAMP domain-containing protein [Chelativorans sp. ZYF759]
MSKGATDDSSALQRLIGRMGSSLSLRNRFIIILLVASLPGMVVALVLAANALNNEREQIEITAERLADIQAAHHTNVIDTARVMLETIVETIEAGTVDDADCTQFLGDRAASYPSFTSLTLVDSAGTIVCANEDSELPAGFPDDALLESMRAADGFIVGDYAVGQSGVPLIIAALPVRRDDGSFYGAVAMGIDLRWLEFLARRMNLPAGSTITAIGGDGRVLNHYRAENVGNEELAAPRESVPMEAYRQRMAAEGGGVLRGQSNGGDQRVYGFQRTSSGNLSVVVGMPQYAEFERYGAALRDTLAAPMAILILALLAAGYASQALVIRWVSMLTGAARKMADGDLLARSMVPHSRYELGRLAAAFDTMAASIQQKQDEIRAKANQYAELLRELNHRVNNNMQMIRSLVRMRGREIADPGARAAIEDIEERLGAMTEIQRLLYDQDDAGHIAADYPVRLGRFLEEFYSSDRVEVRIDAEPIPLPRASSIPLGLIMNELIANACKHAYPEGKGTVRVSLRLQGEHVQLAVADDGAPMPEDLDTSRRKGSMGLRIVRNMSEQLNGVLKVAPHEGGKTIQLDFPLDKNAAADGTI